MARARQFRLFESQFQLRVAFLIDNNRNKTFDVDDVVLA